MKPYSYLFNADDPYYHGYYGDPICRSLYLALLSDVNVRASAFRLRLGDLLSYHADRTIEVRTPEDRDPDRNWQLGGGITRKTDTTLWLALLVDLADSAKETWCSFDPLTLPYQLATHDVFVVSISALHRSTAKYVDRQLRLVPGYLGALQIDLGNPVQFQMLWRDQTERHVYLRGHLGLRSEAPWDDESPLGQQGDWWSDLQFDSIFWLRHPDKPIVGEELVLSKPVDRSCVFPAHPKQANISARGAASRMLYRTGAQLTVVEKVATSVVAEMTARGQRVPSNVTISISRVPEASNAFVRRRRLEDYILNPRHPEGKHKAQLFKNALGFTASDWRDLADQLTQGLPSGVVERARVNPDGTMQFHVHIPVRGMNRRTVPVLSAWLVKPSSPPELTTAYPSPRNVFINDPDSYPSPRVIQGFDASRDEDCLRLYEIADTVASDSASMFIPRPIFIGGQAIAEGKWGSAWVVVKDARRGFARWLVEQGRAETHHRHPGAWIPTGHPYVQRAEAYAKAFVAVLDLNDVLARVETALD